MSTSKNLSTSVFTNRTAARQQVFVGFGVVCLASLMVQAVMTNFPVAFAEPFPIPNIFTNDSTIPSASGLSKAQLQTILSNIADLKDLIKESTASLNDKLDGLSCTLGRKNQEFDVAVFITSMIIMLSAFLWAIGLGILTEGLNKISVTLRNRAWACGLFGANAGMAYLVAMPPEKLASYFSWTVWPMYISMLGGLFSDRETFLADDEKGPGKE